jgi:tetratricopeptide (TPR) repeat protein
MKDRFTILLLFLIFNVASVTAYPQNNVTDLKIDSLKKALQTEKEDTNKVNTLNQICDFYYNQNDYQNVMRFANDQLFLGEKVNFKSGQADAYFNMGLGYSLQKNHPEELHYYLKALNLYKETGNKQGVIICYNEIIAVYNEEDNYGKALENAYAAQKIREETKDKNLIAEGYFKIASTYHSSKDDSEVLKNTLSALKIYRDINDTPWIGRCYLIIGSVESDRENFSESLRKFYDALQFLKKGNNSGGIAYAYTGIASVYEKQGELEFNNGNVASSLNKYHEAEKNKLISLRIYQSLSHQPSIASCFLDLGKINIKLNHLDNRKIFRQQLLNISINRF